jgi:1,4-dihydroxy-2-naphthoate polyprenyltransferase
LVGPFSTDAAFAVLLSRKTAWLIFPAGVTGKRRRQRELLLSLNCRKREISLLNTWFLTLRPWSYTASAVPITVGTVLAAGCGSFSPGLFLLTLAGGIAVHAGTNLINTYGDYLSGVDTAKAPPTAPQLVNGTLRPAAVKRAALLCFALAGAIGLWLAVLRGWPVMLVGLLGLAGGYGYTAGPTYKYKGLGSILVFFLMGPLMTWPAYFIQAREYSWLPVLVSLPIGFLVAAILHANDLRDTGSDREANILTLALILGRRRSLMLYFSLFVAAFICLALLVASTTVPWSAALPLLLIPATGRMFRLARAGAQGSRPAMAALEGKAAQLHFQFGLLLTVGLAVQPLLRLWPL